MYGTLQPGTTNSEFISFTGITQNGNGTATLTGVTRGLDREYPYTEASAFKLPHPGQSIFILSDLPQVFNSYPAKVNAETISGKWTFPAGGNASAPVSGASYTAPTDDLEYASKKYVDDIAIAGSPNATTAVQGLVELATQAESDARTATGGTGASLVATPALNRAVLTHDYAADAGGTDAYAITLTPAVTAYTTGDIYYFKANTVNTGACTLNVNAVGAKALKFGGSDPYTGYIAAGAYVACQYDGTNLNIIWCSSAPSVSQGGQEIYGSDSVGTGAYAITPSPAISAYAAGQVFRVKIGTANTGGATLAVSGLSALPINKNYNSALATGDLLANQIIEVAYDAVNTCWQLLSPTNQNGVFTVNADEKVSSYFTYQVPMVVTSVSAITGWTVTINGGGANISNDGAASWININATADVLASTNLFPPAGAATDNYTYAANKVIRFKTYLRLSNATTNRKGWGLCITPANIHSARTDTTNGEIRFIMDTTTLYAQNANGTATSTDITSGVTVTNWNLYEIVFTPGTDIKYYVNGTLKATHTTNLPTSGTAILAYGVNAGGPGIITMPPVISIQQ
tara:strand:+ start:16707 stop:18428 length:1722 start_codon:yes stop_codon:yes gene_type:complete